MELGEWWSRLTAEQKDMLRSAADENRMDVDIVVVLIDTHCPNLPAGTQWTSSQAGYDFHWPSTVHDFILSDSSPEDET